MQCVRARARPVIPFELRAREDEDRVDGFLELRGYEVLLALPTETLVAFLTRPSELPAEHAAEKFAPDAESRRLRCAVGEEGGEEVRIFAQFSQEVARHLGRQ